MPGIGLFPMSQHLGTYSSTIDTDKSLGISRQLRLAKIMHVIDRIGAACMVPTSDCPTRPGPVRTCLSRCRLLLLNRLGFLTAWRGFMAEEEEHENRKGKAPSHLKPVTPLDVAIVCHVARLWDQETSCIHRPRTAPS